MARGQLHMPLKCILSYAVANNNMNGLASLVTSPNHYQATLFVRYSLDHPV